MMAAMMIEPESDSESDRVTVAVTAMDPDQSLRLSARPPAGGLG
jgi:hypothetical protein